ncbi:hypothetical protein LLG96_03720 [bacterium]|nr:hypothetical protein [bacterium]
MINKKEYMPYLTRSITPFLLHVLAGVLVFAFLSPYHADGKQRIVRILVTSPHIGDNQYRPIADVFAGSIIRELNRFGGLEIVPREESERYLKGKGLPEWVNNRDMALEIGEALKADIVIYSSIGRNYDSFVYSIAFLEVDRDIIQRILHGAFRDSDPPETIGKQMKYEISKITMFIPTPSELSDPGSLVRTETVDPDKLPPKVLLEEYPNMGRYGAMEQLLAYYRVFPGELEFIKFEEGRTITRLQLRDDMDEELTKLFERFRYYADFALRYNMQVYFIKDCSVRAVNVLLANKIPVLYSPNGEGLSVLVGYGGLRPDGYSYFFPFGSDPFESYDFTHRQRVAVMIILPKPGRKGGISKQYLESAVGRYRDEWNKTPTLVEIKEGFLDIIATGLD